MQGTCMYCKSRNRISESIPSLSCIDPLAPYCGPDFTPQIHEIEHQNDHTHATLHHPHYIIWNERDWFITCQQVHEPLLVLQGTVHLYYVCTTRFSPEHDQCGQSWIDYLWVVYLESPTWFLWVPVGDRGHACIHTHTHTDWNTSQSLGT